MKNGKRIEKKGKRIFLFLLLVGALFFPLVSAVNIGVSPAVVNFEDVMRGGYAERTFIVSADSDDPILVKISTRGDVASWLNFSEWNFSVSKSSPAYVKMWVIPDSDTPNGNYTGFVRLMTEPLGEGVEGHAVGKILSSLDLTINVKVTDVQFVDCEVSDVKVSDAEEGDDIVLSMKILNKGNVKIKPLVSFNIWDYDQISILDEESFYPEEILPTTEKKAQFLISSKGLDIGQYWADLALPDCAYKSLLTFDILEPGALSAKGLLLSILTKKEVKVRETVPIEVNFKNVGEKGVKAKFKGQITRGGRIVQVLESEESFVPVGEIEKFGFYFTPSTQGKYVISGRVYYAGKKTFESHFVLEAYGGVNWMNVAYFIMLLFIVVLIYLIRREKSKLKRKMRMLK